MDKPSMFHSFLRRRQVAVFMPIASPARQTPIKSAPKMASDPINVFTDLQPVYGDGARSYAFALVAGGPVWRLKATLMHACSHRDGQEALRDYQGRVPREVWRRARGIHTLPRRVGPPDGFWTG